MFTQAQEVAYLLARAYNALYRRAQAFAAIKMEAEAVRDLRLAQELRPDDKAVAALLQQLSVTAESECDR